MPKLTLREKERINEYVTQETKRCLGILREYEEKRGEFNNDPLFKSCVKKMIEGNPYFKHNLDLQEELKRVS
jgi:hypothetical protein